jgi:Acetyltransferase (GNAT) domain
MKRRFLTVSRESGSLELAVAFIAQPQAMGRGSARGALNRLFSFSSSIGGPSIDTTKTERGFSHGILGSSEIEVRVGRGNEAIQLLDDRWDALLARQVAPNPTLASTWLREMVNLTRGTPIVIVASTKTALLAGGAFTLISLGGRRGLRIATWLGRNGRPVILPDLLIDPDVGSAGELVFMQLLKEDAHGVWLHPTPTDGPAAKALSQVTPWVYSRPWIEGWIVKLPPPKLENLRQGVGYRLRRAQRLGASIEVRKHTDPHAIESALERLFDLHRQRWLGRKDFSHFSDTTKSRDWHRQAIAAMAARGHVRIIEVLEDHTLVASLLGLLAGRGSIFHTPATRIGGRLRGPGHVAMHAWVEAAMEAGAESMHLGRGSGEPQGPKGSLGPTRIESGFLLASRGMRAVGVPGRVGTLLSTELGKTTF